MSGMVHFLLPSSPVFIGVMFECLVLSFVTLLTKSQLHIDGYYYHLPDMPSVVESTTGRSLNILNIPRPQERGLQLAAPASGGDEGCHHNLGQSNDGHQLVQYLQTQLLRTQLLRTLRTKLLRTQLLQAICIFALGDVETVWVVDLWIVMILYRLPLPRFCSLRIRKISLFDVDGTEWILCYQFSSTT
jgi:hypothetical protein